MLSELALGYGSFILLVAVAFVTRVLTLPLLGRWAKRWGTDRLLVFGGLGIIPSSGLWIFSDNLFYLAVLQVFSGLAWAAYELATFLMFFETIPRSDRLRVLTLFNLANSGALVGGALLGAAALNAFGASREGYYFVFGVSSALRALASLWLPRMPRMRVPVVDLPMRTLGMRPSVGVIARPILPVLDPPMPLEGAGESAG